MCKRKLMQKLGFIIFLLLISTVVYSGLSFDEMGSIVKDNTTGLVWLKCRLRSNGSVDSGSCTNPGTFQWADAITACNDLNTGSFGGYNNWRLPSVKELFSMMNYKYYCPPFVDEGLFPNTEITGEQKYWTSTTTHFFVPSNDWAFAIDFGWGNVHTSGKTSENSVRCVAGP